MIQLARIQEALAGLVGWQQGYGLNKIDEVLTHSESGLTFQAAHPLVTLDNIRNVMPTDIVPVPWSNASTYPEGAFVSSSNKTYIAKDAVPEGVAITDTDYWEETTGALSVYLRGLTRDAINAAVQNFLTQKELTRETRPIVDRRAFFDGAARLEATVSPSGKLVGFEIVPVRAMGVTTKIERIGLQMTGATGTVRLYLFHSSQRDPIAVKDLEFTKTNGTFQWFDVDLYLPYISDGTDAGGAWYLLYNQNDLPDGMRALNVSRDWSKSMCETCYGYALDGWKEITTWMQVSPFCTRAPQTFKEFPELPDVGRLSYTNTCNYGMNCVVTVACDLTEFIVAQRSVFTNVLQKQVAVNVLRTLAMNPDVRVNRNQANITREGILDEVDGNPQGRASGLAYELAQAYKALHIDTEGIDRVCLKCNNHGAKYRTV